MPYSATLRHERFVFDNLRILLANASPPRSGDTLAGIAASSWTERWAARTALADVPLVDFLNDLVIPYDDDDVTRFILAQHDAQAFASLRSLTVGELRNLLLRDETTTEVLQTLARGLTPEMV